MRILLTYLVLHSFSIGCFSQSVVSVQTMPGNERWDIKKYIWSQKPDNNRRNVKSVLDFDAIDNWPVLGNHISLAPNGKYFAYTIEKIDKEAVWLERKQDSLIIQSIDNSWRRSFPQANSGFFSADNKQYIFLNKGVLNSILLGSDEIKYISDIESYKSQESGNKEWFAYRLNSKKNVVLKNWLSKKEQTFENVSDFNFDNSGRWFYIFNNEGPGLRLYDLKNGDDFSFPLAASFLISGKGNSIVIKGKNETLSFVNLATKKQTQIFRTEYPAQVINEFKLDASGSQVVFTSAGLDKANSIWYWKEGMDSAILKVSEQAKWTGDGLIIQPSASFSNNDKYIQFFLLPTPNKSSAGPDAVAVDVWSYSDTVLQSAQPNLLKDQKGFIAIINIENNHITQLENVYESLELLNGDFAIIKKSNRKIVGDRFWEKDYEKDSNWIVSLKDGSRHLLPTRGFSNTLHFSPGGQYLVYFDVEHDCHYFSYNLHTAEIKDISVGMPATQLSYKDIYLRSDKMADQQSNGIAGWIENDGGILVYDDYDIWQLDLSGKLLPINLTNGYGALHKIVLCLPAGDGRFRPNGPTFEKNETLLLNAFKEDNKYNGFYKLKLGPPHDPELLYMGPYYFYGKGISHSTDFTNGMKPIKAKENDIWIVKRQSSVEAPNYFVTKNFKEFRQITNLQPQKKYNWLTAELHSFKQLDGTLTQGILYKPENFDPLKKYPVIISFYAQLSEMLYLFPEPKYIEYPNISEFPAWMVSHGYIVFLPDMHFFKGNWGKSTINTIDGAARYLKALPFVDSLHLGAAGHSNSGTFAYYLLSHSNQFAAMSIGAGTTNVISGSLSLGPLYSSNENKSGLGVERNAYGSGGLGNFWENKDLWIDHSPVFNADKVVSPLLLFHNKKDGVRVEQAIEMFLSLRRLEKPVWWLQYDNGYHIVVHLNDLKDFTIRYTQFFDHYLKGAPAPKWMTKGIPYKFKGIQSRYELDPAGGSSLPGKECTICKKWNEKYKKDATVTIKEIEEGKND